jgi:hypothetical protein
MYMSQDIRTFLKEYVEDSDRVRCLKYYADISKSTLVTQIYCRYPKIYVGVSDILHVSQIVCSCIKLRVCISKMKPRFSKFMRVPHCTCLYLKQCKRVSSLLEVSRNLCRSKKQYPGVSTFMQMSQSVYWYIKVYICV